MVSTRGGAQTVAPEPDTLLKKKPVQKTTAKTTATAAPKAKATRAKKAEPEPEVTATDEDGSDEGDELAEAGPAPVKTTRRGRPPVRKNEQPVKNASAVKTTTKAINKPKTAAKPSRSTATRRIVTVSSEDEEEPEEPILAQKAPELKPTKSRATRPTRATAAKEKAAPLSPKKITQVSRAPVKKTTNAKAAPVKPATRGRPPKRKRDMSDENAGLLEVKSSMDEDNQIEVETYTTKTRKTTKGKVANARDILTVGTSIHSKALANVSQQMVHSAGEEEGKEDVDSEDELQADEGSEDELCAPKTPMKRCDPREQAKYSTAKGAQLTDADVPIKTPVRRFQLLGNQQGTPQTQKPYRRPSVPMSEVLPMTVARARDTAMVFPKLQPLPPLKCDRAMVDESGKLSLDPDTPVPEVEDDVFTESAEDFTEQDSDTSLLVDTSTQNIRASDVEGSDYIANFAADDEAGETDAQPELQGQDADSTIVIELAEVESTSQQESSIHTEDSVVITPQEAVAMDETFDETAGLENLPSPPQPETMVWDNLSENVTIPFEFDGGAGPARALPQIESTERLSIVATLVSEIRSDTEAVAGTEDDTSMRISDVEIAFNLDLSRTRQSIGSAYGSPGMTVNISDFVEVSAIAERRDTVPFAETLGETTEADADTVVAMNPTVEEDAEDPAVLDGDLTLMCDEPTEPLTAMRTPIKLTTAEDIAEEDAVVADGDETLIIDEPQCPATIKRSPVKLTTAEAVFDDDDEDAIEGDMTLALNEPTCLRTVKRSPIKLTMAEDYPEQDEALEGDVTLMLNSPAPQQPATPALFNGTHDSHVTPLDLEEANTPRYARSTFSSRRKSVSESSRPTTPDGERRPLNTQQIASAWFDQVVTPARNSSRRAKPSTAQRQRSSRSRSASRPRIAARTPVAVTRSSAAQTPKERFPGLPAQQSYEALIGSTVRQTANADSPAVKSAVKERFPGMPPAQSYQELLDSPAARTTKAQTPETKTPRTLKRKSLHDDETETLGETTPRQALAERHTGMLARRKYAAQTAMPTTRFRTPTRQSPIKRTATSRKPTSLRKLVLKAASTPTKTPFRAPAETPGQVPMTPHPSAPLRGVVALVDVYTHDGACASQSFAILLKRLGAKTTKTFNETVTHVVFKEGSPKLLQALTMHNKQIVESGNGQEIFCVNSRWVNDCDARGHRMPESDEEYAVDLDDFQRTAKRRQKSMEPMSLSKTDGGSIVRDRKSSVGRVSIGRASMKGVFEGPEERSIFDDGDKEKYEDGSEPATPAYLKEPSALIQQTVPAKRVRKLDLGTKTDKQRRLTFADGLEF